MQKGHAWWEGSPGPRPSSLSTGSLLSNIGLQYLLLHRLVTRVTDGVGEGPGEWQRLKTCPFAVVINTSTGFKERKHSRHS